MKNTAMQEIYEFAEFHRDNMYHKMKQHPHDEEYYRGAMWAYVMVMNSIEVSGYEDEKRQIEDAFDGGYEETRIAYEHNLHTPRINGRDYYNRTFKNEEE